MFDKIINTLCSIQLAARVSDVRFTQSLMHNLINLVSDSKKEMTEIKYN